MPIKPRRVFHLIAGLATFILIGLLSKGDAFTLNADVEKHKLINLTVSSTDNITVSPPSQSASFSPYINPQLLTQIEYGSHSHWLQSWRSYLTTVPAVTLLKGIGIQWNVDNGANPELVAQMLSKHGVREARVEIGWSNIDFDDPNRLIASNATRLRSTLKALKKYGIRPLILLNAHHGIPGPVKFSTRILTENADGGQTTLQINDAHDLKVGYSGPSNLTDFKAAEAIITSIRGNTIVLSKPLPKNLKAGASIRMATLRYRPFSPPNTPEYRSTMQAWKQYVGTVAAFTADALGTTQDPDKGFDMQIWNELSFGSDFLYINRYYAQKLYQYDEDSIWTNLVKETANYAEQHPELFQGVLFSNGFASVMPWPASSHLPKRITALSKHPYPHRKNYPHDEPKSTPINALGQIDVSGFVPRYSILLPEYYGTALTTETIIRDLSPIASDIKGGKHGLNARIVDGKIEPTPVWITEYNIDPVWDDRNITADRAMAVKAKALTRALVFYFNKGATKVSFFAIQGGDKSYGLVNQTFLDYATQSGVAYPSDDTAYTSAPLTAIRRIVDRMRQDVDLNLSTVNPLTVVSVSDTHNHVQFKGDGTTAHPDLYDREVFAVLPFQVNTHRYVIPYYVMTGDVMQSLTPEAFTVELRGLNGTGASVTAYDPIHDRDIPVDVEAQGADRLTVKLTAADYPYLLTIEERV